MLMMKPPFLEETFVHMPSTWGSQLSPPGDAEYLPGFLKVRINVGKKGFHGGLMRISMGIWWDLISATSFRNEIVQTKSASWKDIYNQPPGFWAILFWGSRYIAMWQNRCTSGEHETSWQMDVHPATDGQFLDFRVVWIQMPYGGFLSHRGTSKSSIFMGFSKINHPC